MRAQGASRRVGKLKLSKLVQISSPSRSQPTPTLIVYDTILDPHDQLQVSNHLAGVDNPGILADSAGLAVKEQLFGQRNTMALLVDKHRPRSLDTLSYHDDLSERLRSLVCYPKCLYIVSANLNISGPKRGLSSSLGIRSVRRWEEDENSGHSQRALRPGSREDQN